MTETAFEEPEDDSPETLPTDSWVTQDAPPEEPEDE